MLAAHAARSVSRARDGTTSPVSVAALGSCSALLAGALQVVQELCGHAYWSKVVWILFGVTLQVLPERLGRAIVGLAHCSTDLDDVARER